MNKYSFNIEWSDEDQEYVASCPSFPRLSAFGRSEEEALTEAKIALQGFIDTYNEKGIPLPEPQIVEEYSGQTRLRLLKSLHRLAAQMAKLEHVSLNQYCSDAIRMRITGEQVGRKCVEEIRREFAQDRAALASAAMMTPQPITLYTKTVKTITEASTEQTVSRSALSEGRKGN